jgi:predicted Zn-dependent protease
MSATPEVDLAARAVERVAARLSGAEVLAEADRHELGLTRFATSVIHQNVAEDVTRVRLTVHHGGRTTAGTASVIDDTELDGLVQRVVDSVGIAPTDPGWPGLGEPAGPGGTPAPDRATSEATPADRAEVVRAFVEGAGGLETAGYCRTDRWHGALASSSGHALTGAAAECGFAAIAREHGPNGPADGVARLMPLRLSDLDGSALGARAAAKARAWKDPVELPAGHYEVVLEPDAVLDLVGHIGGMAMNGKAVNERISYADLGADQHDPSITLYDDPLALGLAYDCEGTPRQRLTLISSGRTEAFTHDRRTAAVAGATSTGHSVVDRFGSGPIARHLGVEPSASSGAAEEVEGPAADSSVLELVAGVQRGLLVSDFWYTRVLDPRTLSLTGLTRNGVWLIEDGEIVGPVSNMRFTQAYPQALGPGMVRGIGSESVLLPDRWSGVRYAAPALHLASWNLTGNASG